ncbi:MAG: hypothetical protein GXP29_15040 [Planctomycetes bacterium]|nr:hypothetical protein [Planctomycetota bacterium]
MIAAPHIDRKPASARRWVVLLTLPLLLVAKRAQACAVCFGDPESSMARGAVAGVILLGCVVFCVLLGIAGTAFHWSRKARKLALLQDQQ